ncbi:MAG: dihydrolipoyl dehydrogenase [Candidatus Firestonebacteria bacterium]
MNTYDLIVIGGGPGGYVAALYASQLKAKVCLVEKAEIGGTCLNRGCIPTKAILASASVFRMAKKSGSYGVNIQGLNCDFSAVIARKNKIVQQLVNGIKFLFKKRGIEIVNGEGILIDANKVEVKKSDGTTQILSANKIIIATGSEPANIPGINFDGTKILSSTDVLNLTNIPSSIAIIGGGAIGVEFAHIFNTFGVRVSIIEMMSQLIPTEDEEIALELKKCLEVDGIQIYLNEKVENITDSETEKKLKLSSGKEIEAEKVLVGIGRKFNTAGIGLEKLKIDTDKGKIIVNEKMETNIKGVYAIGDITGKALLAHIASHQGIVAAENALGKDSYMDYSIIPSCIFTEPEIASVGLTEKKAKEQGFQVKIGKFPFSASGKAIAIGETKGFVKIVVDTKYDIVLGVQIIGPHATELIGEACMALKCEATTEEFIKTIHAHPTLPETLMEAAFHSIGMPLHTL